MAAGIVKLTLDGGAGNDTILGSQGADVILGGDGDDFVFGDGGNDIAFLGAGHDVFRWDPGDGSDTIEGQDGTDTLLFFGSNASENIEVVATPDYLRVIGAYLKKYNHQHGKKHKGVGFKTMLERQRLYASFFTELRHHTAYRNLDPRQLANRHVEVVVRRWLERGLKTATLHNYLSFLRTFAGWIGKRGMVREPAYYVGSESPHAHRCEVAKDDGSWTAANVEIKAKIAEIASFDSWSGMHLELELNFGLRGKEARHLRPHGAIIPREAADARDAAAFPECQTFLHISAGAKGGRARDVPIATDEQRELLARVLSAVAPGGFVGRPGFTTSQNQARFYYVIRKFGISKAGLGVVAHGLRHQYANDHFEADSGGASPVRGGKARPPGNAPARRRIARALGHNRGRASTAYIGSDAGLPETPIDSTPDRSGDVSG